MESDEFCASLGLPTHLHACGREPNPVFSESELLYRRVRLPCVDYALRVSFKRRSSSSNRSSFSEPADVLWDEGGRHHSNCGVIAFPAKSLDGRIWQSEEDPPVDFKIEVVHHPLRCNYAHTDFRFSRNGTEIEDITAKSVKLQVRDILRPLIKLILAPDE